MATTPHLGLKYDHITGDNLDKANINTAFIALDKADRCAWISTSVAGGAGDQTLTLAQYDGTVLQLTGALTGNRNIILPLESGRRWVIYNATSGAFTITIKGATGTGVVVVQGGTLWLWSDGTNFYEANRNNLAGANVAVLANAAVVGGIPVIHAIDVAAGVTGDVDVTLTHKTRITDVWLVKKSAAGGGTGTIRVFNGASAITDGMSINVADQIIVRPTTINDANWEIAAGGTLRCTRTRTASTDETCTVFCLGYRVA